MFSLLSVCLSVCLSVKVRTRLSLLKKLWVLYSWDIAYSKGTNRLDFGTDDLVPGLDIESIFHFSNTVR